MNKTLTNTTTTDIFINDMGCNIPASSSYTIPPVLYPVWSGSNDVATFINNGKLIVNNGTANLSALDGVGFLGGVTCRYVVQMGYSGVAIVGTYLQVSVGLSSNTNPFIIPEASTIRAWSFSGGSLGTASYAVQVNGVTQFTVSLNNGNVSSASGLNYALNVGDKIAVQCVAGTLLLAIGNPLINLFIQTS